MSEAKASRFREIERLRAVAVLLVVNTHAIGGGWLFAPALFAAEMGPLRGGRLGVDLFFVISGFVVSRSLFRLLPDFSSATDFFDRWALSGRALRVFYSRRFFRIMPLAIAAILVQRLTIAINPRIQSVEGWVNESLLIFSTLYNYVFPTLGDSQMGIFWSLCVEEHFYLTLPVLLVAVVTRSRRMLACLLGVLFVIFVARPFSEPPEGANAEYFWLACSHLRFDALLVGVMLALVAESRGKKSAEPVMPPTFIRWILVPMAILVLWSIPQLVPFPTMRNAGFVGGWAVSALLVSAAAQDRGYVLNVPILGRVLEHIGARSYGIYLFHFAIFRFDAIVHDRWPWYAAHIATPLSSPWVYCTVLFAATLAFSEVAYRVIEEPCIRLGRWVTETPRTWGPAPKYLGATLAAVVVGLFLYQERWWLHRLVGPKNLALHKSVTASSHLPQAPPLEALTDGWLEPELGMCTANEEKPWATLDMGSVTPIGLVRVYNRVEAWQRNQVPLEMLLSSDGKTFEHARNTNWVFTAERPWVVDLKGAPARYIKLQLHRTESFCLSEVEVFAPR